MVRSIAALLMLVACDFPVAGSESGGKSAKPATEGKPAEPVGRAGPAAPAAVDGKPAAADAKAPPGDVSKLVRDYGDCFAGCFDDRAKATDRETCKLNCAEVAEAARAGTPGAPAADVLKKSLASIEGCVSGCHEDRSLNSTNRETCILTCRDAAEVGATPAPSAEPAK